MRIGITSTTDRESRKRIADSLPESRLGINHATTAENNPAQVINSSVRVEEKLWTIDVIAFAIKQAAKISRIIAAECRK